MSDPSAELRPAIRAALKAWPAIQAVFAPGPVPVYDIPPINKAKPYLVLDGASTIPEQAEGIDGAEATAIVSIWSLTSPPGHAQAETLGAAVQAALLGLGDLPSHRVVDVSPQLARYLTDTDGQTAHGIVSVLIQTEPL